MLKKEKVTTIFGGIVSNDVKDFNGNRADMVFHQRMLRAYLKGHDGFVWGFHTNSKGLREPNWFEVKRAELTKN